MKNEPDCSTSSTTVSKKKNQNPPFPKTRMSSHLNKENNAKRKEVSGTSREDFYINERLALVKVPTIDLSPLNKLEKKFSGKCRLYIGNLPQKVTEEVITNLFKKYGEVDDIFVNNPRNFAFLKLDYYVNALKAKTELNNYNLNGKNLIVRWAHPASILVQNLSSHVSDELLHLAFSIFGEVEHCGVVVDNFGKPTGKAVVCFAKKGSALLAKKKCAENSFFLTSSLRPVILEDYEPFNDLDGFSEKQVRKHRNRSVNCAFYP